MKKILKVLLFISIFLGLFFSVFKVLWADETPLSSFYREPKNSIDVAYFGASNVYAHFNSPLAYNLYGFTTGLLSTGGGSSIATINLIKEVQKRQNPKLYIFDLVNSTSLVFSEGDIRKLIDSIPFSKNRTELVTKIMKTFNIPKEDYYSYYFSEFVYHNKWKNLKKENFVHDETIYKGFILSELSSSIYPLEEEIVWNDDAKKLDEKVEKELKSLISYIKENNLNVLFVIPARLGIDIPRMNSVVSILEENNLPVINFIKKIDELNIDISNDLYNKNHLNIYGATKYTLYFAKYLKEHYNLPDHRSDDGYSSWDKEYERLKVNFNKLTNKNYDDILKEYQNLYN